eukprot:TRINITY_DN8879_c0_g3_i1.p1 TRINITY_DN8879_c0_g3~~TRINITY_DN8879_c0_g3_i1.p1  ORF type:complete len:155 (+),score=25.45 TRINITY_DN8879_c0_g3_i1:82-546(+)
MGRISKSSATSKKSAAVTKKNEDYKMLRNVDKKSKNIRKSTGGRGFDWQRICSGLKQMVCEKGIQNFIPQALDRVTEYLPQAVNLLLPMAINTVVPPRLTGVAYNVANETVVPYIVDSVVPTLLDNYVPEDIRYEVARRRSLRSSFSDVDLNED